MMRGDESVMRWEKGQAQRQSSVPGDLDWLYLPAPLPEQEGRYLVGSPRLFVRPVPVVADVPPLDLKGVGGGATAAEGTRHLHVLACLCRHVVGGLSEEGCGGQSEGCGDAPPPQRGTEPLATRAVSPGAPRPFPGQSHAERTGPCHADGPSCPRCPSPTTVAPPQPGSAPRSQHLAKSSGRSRGSRSLWAHPVPWVPTQSGHGTPMCLWDGIHKQNMITSLLRSAHK